MNHYIYLLATVPLGFFILYILNFKKVKNENKLQEFILYYNKTCFHIHHYIICFLIVISVCSGYMLHNYPKILCSIIGLFIGFGLEDLLYKDWMLIKNNCHKSLLIRKLSKLKDVQDKYN